jgi:hypothetical protein
MPEVDARPIAQKANWRGKDGKDWRSLGFIRPFARPPDLAQRWGLAERARTRANARANRQAGGHWFEPSTAHPLKALLNRAFVVSGGERAWVRGNRMATLLPEEPE